jgi:hypothetical protein
VTVVIGDEQKGRSVFTRVSWWVDGWMNGLILQVIPATKAPMLR